MTIASITSTSALTALDTLIFKTGNTIKSQSIYVCLTKLHIDIRHDLSVAAICARAGRRMAVGGVGPVVTICTILCWHLILNCSG